MANSIKEIVLDAFRRAKEVFIMKNEYATSTKPGVVKVDNQTISSTKEGMIYMLPHNHDRDYYKKETIDLLLEGKSDIGHNHDELYSHINHNHDELYAKINHNHNDLYALKDHNHNSLYYTKTEITNNYYNKSTINGWINQLPIASNSNALYVAKKGGQFTTIAAAITKAKTYATQTNRVTIYIASGVYDEEIDLRKNPGIDLVGAGKQATVVQKNLTYPNSPIRANGTCSISGITFKSLSGSNSYALHYEIDGDLGSQGSTGTTIFTDCEFVAYSHQACGVGMGSNCRLEFHNCFFNSGGNNIAFYCHNSPNNGRANQTLLVKNCIFTGQGDGICILVDDQNSYNYGGSDSKMTVEFCGNFVTYGNILFRKNVSTSRNFVPVNDNNFGVPPSNYGNSLEGLNYSSSHVY